MTRASVDDRVDVAGVDCLSIFTPELRRSVDFYSRVFGFRVIDSSHRTAGRSVLMAARRFYLAIHERHGRKSNSTRALCWSFVVDDIDRTRASIWNLGIVPVRDGTSGPHAQPDERAGCSLVSRRSPAVRRSFVIRDPGGNEIELVERLAL
jgi:catechol 2,3-dioxygenase-like lactoylglutathione lyase family enzyme